MEIKKLSKIEIFVCEMIWGCVPTDVDFVRNSNFFKEGLKRFENKEFDKYLDKNLPA